MRLPRIALRLLLSLSVLAGGLLGLETLARAIDWGHSPEHAHQHARESLRFLKPCATVKGSGSRATLHLTSSTFGRKRLPLAPAEGTRRVVVLGESTGAMVGHQLDRFFSKPIAPSEVEVLTCAQPGSGLAHLELRYEEVKDYGADTLVVIFGHNLFREYPTDLETLRRMKWLSRSRFLWSLTTSVGSPPSPHPELGRRFEAFLERLWNETRSKGQQLILATLPQNLWFPPSSFEEPPARFHEAEYLLAKGRLDEAIALLHDSSTHRPTPLDHFQAGVHLHRSGRIAEAEEHLWAALDLDGPISTRAPRWVNEITRRVANRHGIPLVDMERRVIATAPDRLPGWECFADNCHLDRLGLRTEVLAFVEAIVGSDVHRNARDEPSPVSGLPLLEELLYRLTAPRVSMPDWWAGYSISLAVERWHRADPRAAREQVDAFLSSRHFKGLSVERRGLVLAAFAEASWFNGDRDRSEAFLQEALKAGGPRAHIRAALLRVRAGKLAQALRLSEEAVARAPHDPLVVATHTALLRERENPQRSGERDELSGEEPTRAATD